MRLKSQHLVPYLPYRGKAKFKRKEKRSCHEYEIGTIDAIYNNASICCFDTVNAAPLTFKLLLRPMSALKTEAISKMTSDPYTRVELNELSFGGITYQKAQYETLQILFKYHFDVFGLIDEGLAEAIEIETI